MQLAKLFMHDREKLDFVRASYRAVTDKDNFYKAAEVFEFQETKNEFNKYYSK